MNPHKVELKVGDLVRTTWSSATKATREEGIKFYIPPMGIITNLSYNENHSQYLADIVWQDATIPEVQACTDSAELKRFNKYYTIISVENLSLYETYAKSFTARNKRKLYKK